jgi:hypothetical protein
MTKAVQDHLYKLLPTVYRLRDADRGQSLQALLAVLEGERQLLEEDIRALYENWFIETCDEWVVPYLGDLLGVRNLHPLKNAAFSQRAYVANTLGYRRRKGTATMLEQLAHDVTGWPAKAVEFFQLLGTTQYLNHVRSEKGGTVDLRDSYRLERIGDPFDQTAHTADVRHIDNGRGRFNIPNIGLFLWRVQNYPIERGTAFALASPTDGRYTFHPLGYDTPLFNEPQTETRISQVTAENNLPLRLRRRTLWDELEARREALVAGQTPSTLYFGEDPVLAVFFDGDELAPEEIVICNLDDWVPPGSDSYTLPDTSTFDTRAAVDPVTGRLAVIDGSTPSQVEVSYSYGFSGDIGGGPYDRRKQEAGNDESDEVDTIANPDGLEMRIGIPSDQSTIAAALAAWNAAGNGAAVIELEDSATCSFGSSPLTIDMAGEKLIIQAANKQRPVLIGDVLVTGGSLSAELTLNGLLLAGNLHIQGAAVLGKLNIVHCTLAPGTALAENRLTVDPPNNHLQLLIDHSITGLLRIPEEAAGLTVQDSILHAPSLRAAALISGRLDPFPNLTSSAPKVAIAIGDEGPYTVGFSSTVPTDIDTAQTQFEAAIRGASGNPAFAGARVIAVDKRLIILSGGIDPLTVTAASQGTTADNTAAELKLVSPETQQANVLFSGRLETFPTLSSVKPQVSVTIDSDGPHKVVLSSIPSTLIKAAAALQKEIRAVNTTAIFKEAIVTVVDDRLAAMPGTGGTEIAFGATQDDSATLSELALDGEPAAIAASDGGDRAGPPTSLERMTVLGAVDVKELTLASESIFAGPISARRHQAGCVRFSFVPDGSRTPRRYHCQPDLALSQRARELGYASGCSLPESERSGILARTYPSFENTHYGDPQYAQLDAHCADEIREGAEDDSEMGAFCFLQQPQRETNLRASLKEYLRFGLEAGIFFAD